MKHLSKRRLLALIVICVGLNLGIGFIVATMKLPFYLDSIGTVLAMALGGLWSGIACGLLSVIVGSVYTPTLWAYAGTMLVIALYVVLARPLGYLGRLLPTALFGVGLGVVCAIISAPVTTYIWKGVSLFGTDPVTAFFMAKTGSLLIGVLLGGLVIDPMDKLLTSLVAFFLLRSIPARILTKSTTHEPTEM